MIDFGNDEECSLWFDGVPTWLGGMGDEWLHCCVAHDAGTSDIALALCVVQTGYSAVGIVMLVGLTLALPLRMWLNRKKGKTDD